MKKYNARLGIWGSPWVGFANFERIFITPDAMSALINTVVISLSRLAFEFPVPVLLALLLNEMRSRGAKKILQTVYTFPHFLSWVVVSLIIVNFFANSGGLNSVIASLGGQRVNFLADRRLFRPLLYFTSAWKEAGAEGSVNAYNSYYIWTFLNILSDDFSLVNPAYSKNIRQHVMAIYEARGKGVMIPYNFDYAFYSSDAKAAYSVDIMNKITEMVITDADIMEGWNAFVADNSRMVDPLLSELTEYFY